MKYIKSALLFLLLGNFSQGQVCCSLVGATNSGNGSSVRNAHFPSPLDFERKFHWNFGLNTNVPYNGDLNIKYKFSGSTYGEVSAYVLKNTVGFLNVMFTLTNLSESISFEQSQTNILNTNFSAGIRHWISDKIGFLNTGISFPVNSIYSNDDFLFQTGVVPSFSLYWLNTFEYHINNYHSNFNIVLGASKNIQEKSNVYLDDNYSINLSSSLELWNLLIAPNVDVSYQKLLAPLSPYDINRQDRWLSTISIGFNIIPTNQNWNWLQVNTRFPIYGWASKIGFPDGTQPIPSISILASKNGIFGSKQKNQINIFE